MSNYSKIINTHFEARHSRGGGNPSFFPEKRAWFPAFAGMTDLMSPHVVGYLFISAALKTDSRLHGNDGIASSNLEIPEQGSE